MATPMQSAQFRVIVEPIMSDAFDGVYDQRKDEWKSYMREKPGTPRAYHEEPVLYGLGAAPEMPDGTPVTYRSGGLLFNKRYVYKIYGLAFAMTQALVEDGEHINLGRIYSEQLAQAMIETQELNCANVLNRAFSASYLGGDGKSLCASDHPIIGGTYSNILATAAAFSQTSMESMLIQIRKAYDNDGKKVRIIPEQLIVSPDNMFQAEVVLKSVLRSGAANNDINPIKSMGQVNDGAVVVSRLTSATAWFVQTNERMGLQFLTRRKLTKSMEGDFETDSMRYKTTMRYDQSWTNPRAVWGTAGV